MISLNYSGTPPGGQDDPLSGSSLRHLLCALKRHWTISALFVLCAVALTLGALAWAPRIYSSQAKLFVRVGRESVALDPTATTGQTVAIHHDHDYEMNSVVELLQSRALMEKVVDRIGPERLLARASTSAASEEVASGRTAFASCLQRLAGATTAWIGQLDPIDDRERAIHQLQRSVGIRVPKRSHLVCIECRTDDAHKAQEIVAAIVDLYHDQHLQVHRTDGAFEFFEAQAERVRNQLESAGAELSELKNELGWLSTDSQRQLIHGQLEANLERQQTCEASLAAATRRVEGLTRVVADLEARVDGERVIGFDNTGADLMRRELYDLELREAELKTVYVDDDPRVRVVQAQLAEARQVYDDQPPSRAHLATTLNPTYQQVEQAMLLERSQVDSLQGELASLRDQQSALAGESQQLNEQALRLTTLQRQYDLLEANYQHHMENLEQSRINQSLEGEGISNVNLAQAATLVKRPVSPDKLIVALAGMVIAVSGALLLPLCFTLPATSQEAVTSRRAVPLTNELAMPNRGVIDEPRLAGVP